MIIIIYITCTYNLGNIILFQLLYLKSIICQWKYLCTLFKTPIFKVYSLFKTPWITYYLEAYITENWVDNNQCFWNVTALKLMVSLNGKDLWRIVLCLFLWAFWVILGAFQETLVLEIGLLWQGDVRNKLTAYNYLIWFKTFCSQNSLISHRL